MYEDLDMTITALARGAVELHTTGRLDEQNAAQHMLDSLKQARRAIDLGAPIDAILHMDAAWNTYVQVGVTR